MYLKSVMKPNFKSRTRFSENLMGCEMGKISVIMKKPIYLVQAILDLSKISRYEFHYGYMLPKYSECYMDPGSFVYNINPINTGFFSSRCGTGGGGVTSFDKIWSSHSRALTLEGLIAYIMFYKIC